MTAPITSTTPAASAANASPFANAAGGAMGKDEFIKLLVAQMTHQDPLNPVDGQQMASELAQFSSLEQLMNIGTKLDTQATNSTALVGAVNNSSALNLLGRTVTVQTDQIDVGPNGAQSATVTVPVNGGDLTVRIVDANGKTVSTMPIGPRAGGSATLDLAGATAGLPPGSYTLAVDCKTPGSASPTQLTTQVAIRVDGLRFGQDQTYVTSGTRTYPLGVIVSISSPSTTSSS